MAKNGVAIGIWGKINYNLICSRPDYKNPFVPQSVIYVVTGFHASFEKPEAG